MTTTLNVLGVRLTLSGKPPHPIVFVVVAILNVAVLTGLLMWLLDTSVWKALGWVVVIGVVTSAANTDTVGL